MAPAHQPYDALLVVSFGGPERQEDVIPFLENVLRGKNVPRQRMLEVAGHYNHFGGKSPINAQTRALIDALETELAAHGPKLPVYWGNRNWHPMLADTVKRMQADGIRKALAFATSAFGSYSGCRQYREDIDRARAAVGPGAPEIHKLPSRSTIVRASFDAMADRVRNALDCIPEARRATAALVYTAHSIPLSMAQSSPYLEQLQESCRLVSQASWAARDAPGLSEPQRSADSALARTRRAASTFGQLHAGGVTDIVLAPIGFLSDPMEVVYDLDTEAADLCRELGVNLTSARPP